LKSEKNVFIEIKKLISDEISIEVKNFLILQNEDLDIKDYGSIIQNNTNTNNYIFNSQTKDFITEGKLIQNNTIKISEIYFYKNLKEKGWDKLTINSYRGDSKDISSFKQAFFSGYLEGRFTYQDINNFYKNLDSNYKKKNLYPIIKEIKNFFREVNESMTKKIDLLDDLDEDEKNYFYKIYIFYCQLQGMLKGYNKQVSINLKTEKKKEFTLRSLKIEDLLLIQSDGEIPELMRYFIYQKYRDSYKLDDRKLFKKIFNIDVDDSKRIWKRIMWRSRCSVYMKLLKSEEENVFKDLYSGHNAWTEYTETYRTFKKYLF